MPNNWQILKNFELARGFVYLLAQIPFPMQIYAGKFKEYITHVNQFHAHEEGKRNNKQIF